MASKKFIIEPNLESVSTAVEELHATLRQWNCKTDQVVQSVLTIEEVLVHIIQSDCNPERIYLHLKKGLRKTNATITCRGSEITLTDKMLLSVDPADLDVQDADMEPTAGNFIHEMILKLMGERISAKYSKGINTIRVTVEKNDKAPLIDAVMAILLAVITGLTLRVALPADAIKLVADNLFYPVYIIFIRAMQMIMAPLIFFSLASSVVGLSDLRSLGRAGGKMMGMYMLTTLMAILITVGIDSVMLPGEARNIALPEAGAASALGEVPDISPSITGMIINLMPNNMLGTFVASDMLQIIVLAIVCAVTVGHLGKYADGVKYAIETMNAFFSTLTKGITKFLPFAIFGSFGNMMLTIDVSSLGALAYWGVAASGSLLTMALVYCLLILIFGRLNPLVFIRKYFKSTLTAFSSSSSSATMPVSMECCRTLGVSPSIYSFSIPLGCTVNMDGTAILFMSSTLFLARVYGIEITPDTMVSLITMIMLLSLAMPGVPGAAIACFLSIYAVAGVPPEALTIVLGFMSLLELQATATNVTGDGAVTTIVAKSEGALDKQQYYAEI